MPVTGGPSMNEASYYNLDLSFCLSVCLLHPASAVGVIVLAYVVFFYHQTERTSHAHTPPLCD